ncbi:MAG: sodium:proline symporter, partial [Planctomycetaceae bacterium]|nr:sodium:proline symporter [Planctomycetaceae bacterium]
LYWRRVTRAGALASVIAMAISWFWLFYKGLIARPDAAEGDFLVGGMMPVAVIFAISTAALIIVSLFTAPPDERHLARFFRSGEAG